MNRFAPFTLYPAAEPPDAETTVLVIANDDEGNEYHVTAHYDDDRGWLLDERGANEPLSDYHLSAVKWMHLPSADEQRAPKSWEALIYFARKIHDDPKIQYQFGYASRGLEVIVHALEELSGRPAQEWQNEILGEELPLL